MTDTIELFHEELLDMEEEKSSEDMEATDMADNEVEEKKKVNIMYANINMPPELWDDSEEDIIWVAMVKETLRMVIDSLKLDMQETEVPKNMLAACFQKFGGTCSVEVLEKHLMELVDEWRRTGKVHTIIFSTLWFIPDHSNVWQLIGDINAMIRRINIMMGVPPMNLHKALMKPVNPTKDLAVKGSMYIEFQLGTGLGQTLADEGLLKIKKFVKKAFEFSFKKEERPPSREEVRKLTPLHLAGTFGYKDSKLCMNILRSRRLVPGRHASAGDELASSRRGQNRSASVGDKTEFTVFDMPADQQPKGMRSRTIKKVEQQNRLNKPKTYNHCPVIKHIQRPVADLDDEVMQGFPAVDQGSWDPSDFAADDDGADIHTEKRQRSKSQENYNEDEVMGLIRDLNVREQEIHEMNRELEKKDDEMLGMEDDLSRIRKERKEWKEKCAAIERDAKDWKYLCEKRDDEVAEKRETVERLQSTAQVQDEQIKMWEAKYAYLKQLIDGGGVGRAGRGTGRVVHDLGVKKVYKRNKM